MFIISERLVIENVVEIASRRMPRVAFGAGCRGGRRHSFVLAACTGRFLESLLVVWSVLARSAAFYYLLHDPFESSNAHPSLPMASQSIVSGEAVTALARVWLHTAMDLSMTLQVMLTDKTFLAVRALELPVSKMCLNMRLDVLFPAKALVTFRV